MNWPLIGAAVCLLCSTLPALVYDDSDYELLRRGDADSNATIDITDVAVILNWLYTGGSEPPCLNQADVNNDGLVNLSDSIFLAHWLFAGGAAPPPTQFPGGSSICGVDDTPTGCATSPCP